MQKYSSQDPNQRTDYDHQTAMQQGAQIQEKTMSQAPAPQDDGANDYNLGCLYKNKHLEFARQCFLKAIEKGHEKAFDELIASIQIDYSYPIAGKITEIFNDSSHPLYDVEKALAWFRAEVLKGDINSLAAVGKLKEYFVNLLKNSILTAEQLREDSNFGQIINALINIQTLSEVPEKAKLRREFSELFKDILPSLALRFLESIIFKEKDDFYKLGKLAQRTATEQPQQKIELLERALRHFIDAKEQDCDKSIPACQNLFQKFPDVSWHLPDDLFYRLLRYSELRKTISETLPTPENEPTWIRKAIVLLWMSAENAPVHLSEDDIKNLKNYKLQIFSAIKNLPCKDIKDKNELQNKILSAAYFNEQSRAGQIFYAPRYDWAPDYFAQCRNTSGIRKDIGDELFNRGLVKEDSLMDQLKNFIDKKKVSQTNEKNNNNNDNYFGL